MSPTIKASEFKARCLKLMDEVKASGEEIVITKNGEPVAKLVAHRPAGSLFGALRGAATVLGDVVAPTDPSADRDK